jgi:hypothetical protein
MPQYEVWCHSCNVTFPPEQKRCVHCGARTRPDPPGRRLREPALLTIAPLAFHDESARPAAVPEVPVYPMPVDSEEEPARRSLLRAGMTILWIVLLAAGYAWRACSQ